MNRCARCSFVLLTMLALGGCLRGSGALNPDDGEKSTESPLDAGGDDARSESGADATESKADAAGGADDAATDMADALGAPDMFQADACGNGVIERGETCEECELACDDGNACTADEAAGDPATCTAFCRNRPTFDCIDADGCCPSSCSNANDSDCSATCGDGVVDAGETCDPMDACPTTCDDEDPATRDITTGSPANCNVTCTHVPILRCLNADGFCPAGCTAALDDDCSSSCGNGFIEPDETCDPPGSCPTTCDDGNACTDDVLSGSAATCDVNCTYPTVTTCVSGDGCCADGCSAAQDAECSATCGDRQVQAPETCDGPSQCNSIACDQGGACTAANRTGNHQGCNVLCGYAEIYSCGNGDGCCPAGCTAATDDDCEVVCGNGVVEPGEFCDPPGQCETSCIEDADVCTTTEYLGDPATCDGRCANVAITTCGTAEGCCAPGCNETNDPDCAPICGNGVIETGELCDGSCPSCDDANACTSDSSAGSAATCDLVCTHQAITICVSGDACCPPGCTALQDLDCP